MKKSRDTRKQVVRRERRHGDVPLFFGQCAHLIDCTAAQEEPVVTAEGLIAGDVPVESEVDRVLVQCGKVIRHRHRQLM